MNTYPAIKYLILYCLLGICTAQLYGQVDTIAMRDSLPNIIIKDQNRIPNFIGIEIQNNLQNRLSNYHISIPNTLQENSNIYVKDYGPTGLSTVSSPGSSAAQTVVSIEGLDIKNSTLGLTDLSLYPSFLFSNISVHNNLSHSSTSQSIGDIIQLGLEVSPQSPTEAMVKIGSYGQKETGISFSGKAGNYSQITKVYATSNKNNFAYRNIDQEEVFLTNARMKGLSGITKHAYQLNANNVLNFIGLISSFERQIPPTRLQYFSDAEQVDRTIKIMAKHSYSNSKISLLSMVAYSDDQVKYNNPAIRIFSKNQGSSWQVKSSLHYNFNKKFTLQSGLQATMATGKSDAYNGEVFRKELEGNIAGSLKMKNWNFKLDNALAITNFTQPYYLPSLDLSFQKSKNVQLKGNIKRIYRIPSLDDLFWQPGGNPSLKPEIGWAQMLGVNFKSEDTNHALSFSIFNKNVQNWIIWIPNELNIWQPENISAVKAQGSYFNYQWTKTYKEWSYRLNAGYNFTSAMDKNTIENQLLRRNKQLIYSPKHQVKINTSIIYKKIRFNLHQRWVSTTFADPLNKIELPAYFISNVQIFRKMNFGENEFEIGLFANNVWNAEYEIVKNYPLPGRNFLIQLNFRMNK